MDGWLSLDRQWVSRSGKPSHNMVTKIMTFKVCHIQPNTNVSKFKIRPTFEWKRSKSVAASLFKWVVVLVVVALLLTSSESPCISNCSVKSLKSRHKSIKWNYCPGIKCYEQFGSSQRRHQWKFPLKTAAAVVCLWWKTPALSVRLHKSPASLRNLQSVLFLSLYNWSQFSVISRLLFCPPPTLLLLWQCQLSCKYHLTLLCLWLLK